jgi:hypothetical protein
MSHYSSDEYKLAAKQVEDFYPPSIGSLIPLVHFPKAYAKVADRFGPPQGMDPGIFEAGPCALWKVSFDCGLDIVLRVDDHPQWGDLIVYADQPECSHIVRHLELGEPEWRWDRADKPLRAKHWSSDFNWRLMRQDEYGQRFVVADKMSRREAECLCREYERRGHKQAYTVEESD